MKTKFCSKCGEEKNIDEFPVSKQTRDGVYSWCKDCKNNKIKEYYYKNKEHILKRHKKYYYKERKSILKQKKEYYYKNKDILLYKHKLWIKLNKDKVRYAYNEHQKNRFITDSLFKIKRIISNNIRTSFKRNFFTKRKNTKEILGCTIEFFKEYIESKFTDGMTWDNYGRNGWHLDHIIPIASANTEEDVIRLNHYTNFQPLWAKDNLEKRDKIPNIVQFKLL